MKKLSIIIPCYNEVATIKPLLQKVAAVAYSGWQMELVIVDDGSTDGTREILKHYESKFKVIYHQTNQGKGSAVKTGLAAAAGDYRLIQDADLEYEPAEIPTLLAAAEKNPGAAIYGSRNLYHIPRRGMYLPRFGVWLITKEFNWLYGTKLTDLWTCYKLFPRSATNLFAPGHFESELIFSARLIKNGYPIFEVPISHQPRSKEAGKKIRYPDGLRGLWQLLIERGK